MINFIKMHFVRFKNAEFVLDRTPSPCYNPSNRTDQSVAEAKYPGAAASKRAGEGVNPA